MMQRVVSLFAHAMTAKAVSAWHQWAQTRRTHRVVVRRAAARMCRAGLTSAMERWQLRCAHEKKVRGSAQRVLLHFLNGLVGRAFTVWCGQARWRVRSRKTCSHVLARWHRSTEVHFFETWRFATEESRRLDAAGKGVALRLMEALLAKAFVQWAEVGRWSRYKNNASTQSIPTTT